MHCANIINTNIYINGRSGLHGCGMPMMGFCSYPSLFLPPPNPYTMMGMAAGAAAAPWLPYIFKGIGKAASWLATDVIAPSATFVWNKAIKPFGSFMWNSVMKPVGNFMWNSVMKPVGNFMWNNVMKPVGNFFGNVGSAIGRGVSKVWNKIFHKKAKPAE